MEPGACETDEGAEFGGGPLWGGGLAVTAGCVGGSALEGEELFGGEGGISRKALQRGKGRGVGKEYL